jgi:hypothetical protein
VQPRFGRLRQLVCEDGPSLTATARDGMVMDGFDYEAPAELFASRVRGRKRSMQYRRFDTAAEAIRFVIEEIPAPILFHVYLQVRDERLGFQQIRELYEDSAYPLLRRIDPTPRE